FDALDLTDTLHAHTRGRCHVALSDALRQQETYHTLPCVLRCLDIVPNLLRRSNGSVSVSERQPTVQAVQEGHVRTSGIALVFGSVCLADDALRCLPARTDGSALVSRAIPCFVQRSNHAS